MTTPNALLRVDELPGRGIGEEHFVPRLPEQLPERAILGAREQIPDRDLDGPVAAVVEVDRLDHAVYGPRIRSIRSEE
jgi:hypothetical protein